ncbi:MAG: PEGA domain-containing protein [Myxococcales bacterium]
MPDLEKVEDVSTGSNKKWVVAGVAGAAVVLLAVVGGVFLLGGKGGILVDYEPVDARVFVDGVELCAAAPCASNDLKPGPHRVEIRRDRYEPVAQEVEVPRGDIYRFGPKVKLKAIIQNLLVTIASEPSDAEIRIDGKVLRPLGSRPPAKSELPLNKPFEIEVTKPGFLPWKKTMTLGETDKPPVDVWAELTKLQMLLKFDSKPTGAKLIIDDKPVGKTPMQVDDLDPSIPHSVLMQKDGYKDASHTILPGTPSNDIVKELEKK